VSDKKQPNNKNAAGVLTTAAMVSLFVFALLWALPAVLINEIIEEFELTGAGQGLMGSLLNTGLLLSLIIIPMFQGRAQKIKVIIFACLYQAVMLSVIGFSPVVLLFGAATVLLGFGGGFTDVYCNSVIVDVRKADAPKYLGYLHGLFGVGSLIAPLLIFWLLQSTDWRGVSFVLVAVLLLTALFVFLLVRRSTKSGATTEIIEKTLNKADIFDYIRKKRTIILILTSILLTLALSGVISWIVRYMTVRHDSAGLGAIALSVYWLCATFNRFFFSQFIKRAPMRFLALGAVFFGISIIVGVLLGNAIVMCIMAGAAGLFSGHFVPVLISECAIGYEGKTTFTTSFIMIIMGATRIVTPLIMAYSSSVIGYDLGMMIPPVTIFAVVLLSWISQRDKAKQINNQKETI